MNRLFIFSLGLVAILMPRAAHGIGQTPYILHRAVPGAFPVVQGKSAAAIYTDSADWPGVARAAADLSADIGRVTGIAPALVRNATGVKTDAIIVGTIGRSPVVDQLIRNRKLDVSGVAGKWEAFVIQVVTRPLPGVSSALVIAGSDKRGTTDVTPSTLRGFVESDGYASIEAAHYSRTVPTQAARWEVIPDVGRTLSGMSVFPVDAPSLTPGPASPCLEYRMYLFHAGKAEVNAILSPTLDFVPGRGLRLAMAFDEQPPRIVDALEHNTHGDCQASVRDSIRSIKTALSVAQPGYHTLKIWMVDPGVVLQKLIVDLGGRRPGYLGPPESIAVN